MNDLWSYNMTSGIWTLEFGNNATNQNGAYYAVGAVGYVESKHRANNAKCTCTNLHVAICPIARRTVSHECLCVGEASRAEVYYLIYKHS